MLAAFDMLTMKQVREKLTIVAAVFPSAMYSFLVRTSVGIDSDEGDANKERKKKIVNSTIVGSGVRNVDDEEMDEGRNFDVEEECGENSRDNTVGGVDRKSLSVERTFSPMKDLEAQVSMLVDLCKSVEELMVKENIWAKTVTLKLKNANYLLITRSITVDCNIAVKCLTLDRRERTRTTNLENLAPAFVRNAYVRSKEDLLCLCKKLLIAEQVI